MQEQGWEDLGKMCKDTELLDLEPEWAIFGDVWKDLI